ncbi:MAG: phosphoribosylglycinamide formyltransferase [Patescibacteria group bacterium]|nr:phosphoribosylglycinamide formyltransferase [Patescibacteria group bacterium]
MNLAIFVSGGGTTLNAIAEAIESGRLKSRIVLVIASKAEAGAIENYVKPRNIPYEVISKKNFENEEDFGKAILDALEKYGADFICLAGFLQKIPANVIEKFRGRIINSHPGDTRKYGGAGMYGKFVHEAVITAGEPETMSTIHWVNEIYDDGEIISQMKLPITPDIKTPEELAAKLLPIEWENYISVLEKIETGE